MPKVFRKVPEKSSVANVFLRELSKFSEKLYFIIYINCFSVISLTHLVVALTHYMQLVSFYTSWKYQKTRRKLPCWILILVKSYIVTTYKTDGFLWTLKEFQAFQKNFFSEYHKKRFFPILLVQYLLYCYIVIQFVIFNPWKVRWNWIAFSQTQNSFVLSPGLVSPD